MDIRHQKRKETVQNLFSLSFNSQGREFPNPEDKTAPLIVHNIEKIDTLIQSAAKKFPVEKIAKVDLAVLRLALYELTVEKKNPPKVIINEAVELAKELGGEHSYSFVNGVLGHVIKEMKIEIIYDK